jgi:hypothetical protein
LGDSFEARDYRKPKKTSFTNAQNYKLSNFEALGDRGSQRSQASRFLILQARKIMNFLILGLLETGVKPETLQASKIMSFLIFGLWETREKPKTTET